MASVLCCAVLSEIFVVVYYRLGWRDGTAYKRMVVMEDSGTEGKRMGQDGTEEKRRSCWGGMGWRGMARAKPEFA